jgi:hypothetical protein
MCTSILVLVSDRNQNGQVQSLGEETQYAYFAGNYV